MHIEALINYDSLCRQLGVGTIAGCLDIAGKPAEASSSIRLRAVSVDDDDAREKLVERDIMHDDYGPEPPSPRDVRDWIGAIAAGDILTAEALVARIFSDWSVQVTCEDALRGLVARRAA